MISLVICEWWIFINPRKHWWIGLYMVSKYMEYKTRGLSESDWGDLTIFCKSGYLRVGEIYSETESWKLHKIPLCIYGKKIKT